MIGYLTPNYPLVAAFRSLPKTRTRPADPASQRIFRMAPKLSDHLRDGEYLASKGDLDRPISGLALDSRRVMPGNVFFALPGRRADGSAYIDEAIQRGAVAVVGEKIPAGTATRVTYVQVADARRTLALVARRYFGFPDRSLDLNGRGAVGAHRVQRDPQRSDRPLEHGGVRDVEYVALAPEQLTGGLRLAPAVLRQIDVGPAGEAVLEIPLAFSVAQQDELVHGRVRFEPAAMRGIL